MKFQNYKEYLRNDNILSFEEEAQIMESILSTMRSNTTEGKELVNTMICCAVDYADIRARWGLFTTIEMTRMNETRSQYHELFIQATDKLADSLMKNGYKTEWREHLGDNRKRIGDFGCYIAYLQGIDAR